MDGGRKRVRKIACNNMLNARIRIFAGDVSMGLDSRINAMLLDRIKAYVDARVDEKIAIALSREELRKQLTSAELDVYIENRIKKALCQYRC
jgi:hypothetical protein